MIHIEAAWLACGASDLRAGMDTLLARVVHSFSAAQAHHAYVFANRAGTRLKVLVYDGAGLWLATRRLQSGRFHWLGDESHAALAAQSAHTLSITQEQLQWLVAGLPWQQRHPPQSITTV